MEEVVTNNSEMNKIEIREGSIIKENLKIHLNIDKQRKWTEIDINTADEKLGEGLLTHINTYTTPNLHKIGIKNTNGIQMISQAEILFAEIFDKQLSITTTEETITTRLTLSNLQHKLSNQKFIQITKSSIINIEFVKKVSPSFSGNFTATLTTGKKVSISRRYVKNFNKALNI